MCSHDVPDEYIVSLHGDMETMEKIIVEKLVASFQEERSVEDWIKFTSGETSRSLHLLANIFKPLSASHIYNLFGVSSSLEKRRAICSVAVFIDAAIADFRDSYTDVADVELLKQKSAAYLNEGKSILRNLSLGWFEKGRCVTDEAIVQLPARIGLAGGKSDLAPFTLEKGGSVCHMAVTIDGILPISASAAKIGRPVISLVSDDLAVTQEIDEIPHLKETLGDPLILHKVTLQFFFQHWLKGGFNAGSINSLLSQWCGVGYGLELRTSVKIPKGSGLGTSSILFLACLRALKRLFGCREPILPLSTSQWPTAISTEELEVYPGAGICASEFRDEINAVLAMEQMLGTGGGWNDPIGGGLPGFKLTSSEAGPVPEYSVRRLVLSADRVQAFNDRMLVVYTGQQRRAQVMIFSAVMKWTLRHTGAEALITRFAAIAKEMYSHMEDFAAHAQHMEGSEQALVDDEVFKKLGDCLEEVKLGNIRLNPAWSNPHVDRLFNGLAAFVTGSCLIGAGSGGFIIGFLRSGVDKVDVVEYLKHNFPISEICDIRMHSPSN